MTPETTPGPFDALHDALEDERPLDVDNPADRALYVPELHKVEGINPADGLLFQIGRARQGSAWFFTGHRGVGKSTELRRIAHELRGRQHVVVLLKRCPSAENVIVRTLLERLAPPPKCWPPCNAKLSNHPGVRAPVWVELRAAGSPWPPNGSRHAPRCCRV